MLMYKAVQHLVMLTMTVTVWESRTEAATSAFKLCGRKLSEIMSRVCHVYNSPSWDVPTVVEQPAPVARRKRQAGIADECCTYGCTWEQLSEYCSISAPNPLILEDLDPHMISDRSAEKDITPSVVQAQHEGRAGRAEKGKKRWEKMGLKNVARAAPVVGTVSPLLTWGRTLNTDWPLDRNRYAYHAVYTT